MVHSPSDSEDWIITGAEVRSDHGKTNLTPSRSILRALAYLHHTYILNTEEVLIVQPNRVPVNGDVVRIASSP